MTLANYIDNILSFNGPKQALDSLLSGISSGEAAFDFNQIIPMPAELDIEEDPIALQIASLLFDDDEVQQKDLAGLNEVRMNIRRAFGRINAVQQQQKLLLAFYYFGNVCKYGYCSFSTWRKKYWGINSNAELSLYDQKQKKLSFRTRWNKPDQIIQELSKRYPEVTFTWRYSDILFSITPKQEKLKGGVVLSTDEIDPKEICPWLDNVR